MAKAGEGAPSIMQQGTNGEVKLPLDRLETDSHPLERGDAPLPDAASKGSADQPKSKDAWDKADIIGKLLGSILIPVGVAAVGIFINLAIQERTEAQKRDEISSAAKLKTEEIAITVLQSKETPLPAVREWALGVFKELVIAAGRPLPNKAQEELQHSPLPSTPNTSGAAAIAAQFEGFRAAPYQDAFGTWTIGFGHTQGVGPETPPITIEQARSLLAQDMKASSDAVDQLVKVPLTADQRDALVDFVYNVGIANFARSTLLTLLNAGRYDEVGAQLQRWAMQNGIASPALEQRRKREAEIWKNGKASQP